MVMHRVALLDDHPAILAGLRRLIGAERDLEVVAAGTSAQDVARQLRGTPADVLIADYDLGRSDGLAYCLRAKRHDEAPGIIIYSAYGGPALILAARAAGADAIVDKAEPVDGLLTAIRAVAAGKRMLPAVPRCAFEAAVSKLEDEDLAVFAMLLDGTTPQAIAQALRTDGEEINRRAQRIVGRLRPVRGTALDDLAASGGGAYSRDGSSLDAPGYRSGSRVGFAP
jgi:DNA-binding NarL/FixJ family response regulator